MNTSPPPKGGARTMLVLIPVVILFAPLGYSVASTLLGERPEAVEDFLERPAPEHRTCVDPDTEYMRYHHMDLLKEIRDQVLRDGIRGEVLFNGCKRCHTSRERFCDKCHDAVNLNPDCFGCHDYP